MPGSTRCALVALLALVAGCGSQQGKDDAGPTPVPATDRVASSAPATPSAPASTTVPDGFPITEGMPTDDSGGPITAGPDGVGMRVLDFCGTRPLRGLQTTDRVTAASSGPEYSSTRDLMVFAGPEEPAALAAEVLAAARACPVEESGPGSELRTEVRPSPAGPEAATVVHTYATDGRVGPGAEIIEVVPRGTALLVTSAYAEWTPGPILDDGVAQDLAALTPVLDAMSVFGAPVPGPAIPAGFPLDLDLPPEDGDHDVVRPSPGADGVGEVEVCGSTLWPVGPAQARLATNAHGPELADARDLVVLADAEAASGAVARASRLVEACSDAPAHQVWSLHDADTGHDSATFSLTWDDGPGASVFQLTRVGRALLLTHVYGEGSLDTIGPTVRDRSALTRAIAPAMCTFTADGC